MTTARALPGGLSEPEFLRAYAATALRKPQVVADNVLNGIFLADASYRPALTALLVQEAVEAARRLNAVWIALTDRTRPVAQRLAGPLPGAEAWAGFAAAVAAASADPAALLEAMAIDASALESAEELAAFDGLVRFAVPLRVFEAGVPTVTVHPGPPPTLLLSTVDAAGEAIEARLPLADEQVVALGDAAGDFVTWALDFLGAFIDAREAAGRRGRASAAIRMPAATATLSEVTASPPGAMRQTSSQVSSVSRRSPPSSLPSTSSHGRSRATASTPRSACSEEPRIHSPAALAASSARRRLVSMAKGTASTPPLATS